MRYLVTCNLISPGDDYVDLAEAIERVGSEFRDCGRGTWLVTSERSAGEIRDELKPHLGPSDEILVVQIHGEAAWKGGSGHSSEEIKRFFAPT